MDKDVQEATKAVEDQQGELERHLGKSAEVGAGEGAFRLLRGIPHARASADSPRPDAAIPRDCGAGEKH